MKLVVIIIIIIIIIIITIIVIFKNDVELKSRAWENIQR